MFGVWSLFFFCTGAERFNFFNTDLPWYIMKLLTKRSANASNLWARSELQQASRVWRGLVTCRGRCSPAAAPGWCCRCWTRLLCWWDRWWTSSALPSSSSGTPDWGEGHKPITMWDSKLKFHWTTWSWVVISPGPVTIVTTLQIRWNILVWSAYANIYTQTWCLRVSEIDNRGPLLTLILTTPKKLFFPINTVKPCVTWQEVNFPNLKLSDMHYSEKWGTSTFYVDIVLHSRWD